MRIITIDDFKDVLIKGTQKGWPFILSKFHFSGEKRTKTAFGKTRGKGINWWQIPYVQRRWNAMISGDSDKDYLRVMTEFLKEKNGLSLISLGSGRCEAEIKLAKTTIFKEITCIELSKTLADKAKKSIEEEGLENIQVICENIYDYTFKENEYDVVFFTSSLHHFKNLESLLKKRVSQWLKKGGYLIINEYVGPDRLQYSKKQLLEINKALKTIPKKYRKIRSLPMYKNQVKGPGLIRMILADPSECIESSKILPIIHQNFNIVIEKPFGGSILSSVLKDIADHFFSVNAEKQEILDTLFKIEDNYLKKNQSDFIFGIYKT